MHFLNVFIHLLRVPVKIKQSLSHNVTSNAAFIRIKSLNVFRVLLELVCVYVMDFFYLGFDDSMRCTAVQIAFVSSNFLYICSFCCYNLMLYF